MAQPVPSIKLLFTRNTWIHRDAFVDPPKRQGGAKSSNMIRVGAGETVDLWKVDNGNPKYDAADFIISKSAVRANADKETIEQAQEEIATLKAKLASIEASPAAKKAA